MEKLRNGFIYASGSNFHLYGNSIIRLIDVHTLQVEVENLEKVIIREPFGHKTKQVENGKRFKEIINRQNKKLPAIIIRKNNKFYLQVILEENKEITVYKANSYNTAGTDFNKNFISLVIPDIHFEVNTPYKKGKDLVAVIDKMFQLPEMQNIKQIGVENLKFENKKLKDLGNKVNGIVHSLPYGVFKDTMHNMGIKHNKHIVWITPKNSSKEALKNKMDRHFGAARIIATKAIDKINAEIKKKFEEQKK